MHYQLSQARHAYELIAPLLTAMPSDVALRVVAVESAARSMGAPQAPDPAPVMDIALIREPTPLFHGSGRFTRLTLSGSAAEIWAYYETAEQLRNVALQRCRIAEKDARAYRLRLMVDVKHRTPTDYPPRTTDDAMPKGWTWPIRP